MPPPTADDTVQYSKPVDCEQKPPVSSSKKSLEDEVGSDVYHIGMYAAIFYIILWLPIHLISYYADEMIDGHLILLQLVPIQPCWRSFGSAAGLGEEILDMVRNIA